MSDDIWLASFRTSYRYARVSRSTGLETGAIECFTGGSISRDQDTDTYESASLDYVGRLDMGNDFVRIYLDAEDPISGASRTVCLGTFECSTPSRTVSGEVATGIATLYGQTPRTSRRTTSTSRTPCRPAQRVVSAAKAIAEGCGLEVVAEPSDCTLSTAWASRIAPPRRTRRTTSWARSIGCSPLQEFQESVDQQRLRGRVLFRRYLEPGQADRPHLRQARTAGCFPTSPTSRTTSTR